jgi:hypothetical protein
MNCEVVQRRLMSALDPAQVPPDLRAHLLICGPCRDWQGQLLQLEQHVRQIPVPSSRGKSRLLKQLRGTPSPRRPLEPATAAAALVAGPARASASGGSLPFRTWPRQRLLGSLAAAILFGLLGWWLLGPGKTENQDAPMTRPANDPLLASLLQYDVRLATANSPKERIGLLADVAQTLHDESRFLASEPSGEQLNGLAGLYEQVIRYGINKQAPSIPASERPRVFKPIIEQLEKAAQASERLVKKVSAEQALSVQKMANVAWDGRRYLTTLLAEGRG